MSRDSGRQGIVKCLSWQLYEALTGLGLKGPGKEKAWFAVGPLVGAVLRKAEATAGPGP